MNRRDFLRRAGALALSIPVVKAIPGCGSDGGTPPAADAADGADAAGGDIADTSFEVGPDVPSDIGGSEVDATDASDADTEPDPPLPDYEYEGPLGPEALFEHGVASGDPLEDRVVLWTRASAERPGAGGPERPDLDVYFEVARDPDFNDRVAAGWLVASAASDFCVKVDVTRLSAGATYYYRFKALGQSSPVGRTRTAARGALSRLRLAVCSCSNYANGYFLGYREIAARPDLDLVVHLGDYIYEYGRSGSAVRPNEPAHEILSLTDYRQRYALYRRDADLAEAHRQHPWVVVWDDHESANNSFRDGADNHDPMTEGTWEARKLAAIQAWHEWQPVREAPMRNIWRSFRFGDLVDLVMLDTRLWGRDEQVFAAGDPAIYEPDRQLLGADQEAWLVDELSRSSAKWTVLGQQVMMGQLDAFGVPINNDQWDGYQAARQRLYDAVKSAPELQNLVVLTGDIHSSWAIDLRETGADYDPATGEGALGVEVVVPGITSSGLAGGGAELFELVRDGLPHIRWYELTRRGYAILDFDESRAQATWHHFTAVNQPTGSSSVGAVYASYDGTPHMVEETTPASPPANPPAPAP